MKTGCKKMKVMHNTRHLDEEQLLPPDVACRFCGSEDRVSVVQLQKDPLVVLLTCPTCHAASASRMPTTEALVEYYGKYYIPGSSDGHDEKVTFDLTDKFARHFASRIVENMSKTHMSILDFGGGDGTIAVKTASQLLGSFVESIDIMLVDYNESLTRVDDQRISLSRHRTLEELPAKGYDFVVASAIVEHVPEPRETLIRLLSLLNEGGIFYARTPYAIPFIKLFGMLRLNWDFAYPGHLHDLGPDFWNTIFARIGADNHYQIIESKPSIIQSSLKSHFFECISAHLFKAPWYLLGNCYRLVGGWEVFVKKTS